VGALTLTINNLKLIIAAMKRLNLALDKAVRLFDGDVSLIHMPLKTILLQALSLEREVMVAMMIMMTMMTMEG
jgi:hypothetical protein